MNTGDVASHIHHELSGTTAQTITEEITHFHRPPGGAGYHAATNLVTEWLRRFGIEDIAITTYPLDGETVAGGGALPLAWEPHGVDLRVVSPVQEPVVDMVSVSSCLAWWSKPTPEGGVTAELVDVGTGESAADYEGKDVRGKIVLIGHTERPAAWNYAAEEAMKRGAIGIVSDYLFYTFAPDRTRESLPEAVQLLRLPNQYGTYDAWGCSISYPAAERLRHLLRLGQVTLHADIRCRIFEGHGQNVLATLPGRELPDESVYFIAHTSAGTCPCANCAAGPALMVEIARTFKTLIERGDIERPRRSIKFLFIIEGMGSRTFITDNQERLSTIHAAFCLDSVGHDQGKLKSTLLFYRSPDSTQSYINDFYAAVMERAPKDGTWVFANDANRSPVHFTQAPFTPWSDNRYWVTHGVPSPLIMSWPDLYFHTQLLTADNTDPRVFRRAGVTTALAAYEIANAGALEASSIADDVVTRSTARLNTIATNAIRTMASGDLGRAVERAGKEIDYIARRDIAAVESAYRLVPPGDALSTRARAREQAHTIERAANEAKERIKRALDQLSEEG
jgi:aminopeptidase YwaD